MEQEEVETTAEEGESQAEGKGGCGGCLIALIAIIAIFFVLGTCSGGSKTSARDADVGDRVVVSGTITRIASNEFWIDGDDGLEYKCWPPHAPAIKTLAPGERITVHGRIASKSMMSANLENVTWD